MRFKLKSSLAMAIIAAISMIGHAAAQNEAPPILDSDENRFLIAPGELPTYELLRYTEGEEVDFTPKYMASFKTLIEDAPTTGVVFREVPDDSEFARLTLDQLIELAEQNNLDLLNSRRNVIIARSQTRSSEADFIPFVDLIGETRYSERIDREQRRTILVPNPNYVPPMEDPSGSGGGTLDAEAREPEFLEKEISTTEHTYTWRNEGGVESGVDLPTGGNITGSATVERTDTSLHNYLGTEDTERFDGNAEIRFLQPLLRGGGYEVGMASLRQARLQEINRVLNNDLVRRNVVFNVISTYFQILQAARQLEVSREAIAIRLAFLEETKVRYGLGRVDESEILRAEIQYLNELQSATERQRSLEERRESMLIFLGLPLDTPMSFLDITDELARRGRVMVPAQDAAVNEALSNRVELMQSDIDVALAEISQRVARNDTWPDLNFDAGIGRFDGGDKLSDAVGPDNDAWDAGFTLRVPLINIQRREAYKRAVITLQQQTTNRLSTERNLTQEALEARRNLLATEVQLTILSKSVEQARKSLELINGRFEVGFASVTEVRLAQDDLFSAQTNYNTTLLNYQIAVARLYVALGRPLT